MGREYSDAIPPCLSVTTSPGAGVSGAWLH